MSICIRGMDLPKEDGIIVQIDSDGFAIETGRLLKTDDNCYFYPTFNNPKMPVISFQNHGDLIDRDALLQEFYKAQASYDAHGRPFSDAFMSGNEICAEWWAVERKVEDAPTVIPADGEGEE